MCFAASEMSDKLLDLAFANSNSSFPGMISAKNFIWFDGLGIM
jgi:hypothetical protein